MRGLMARESRIGAVVLRKTVSQRTGRLQSSSRALDSGLASFLALPGRHSWKDGLWVGVENQEGSSW